MDPAVDRMFSWLEKCQENQTIGAEARFSTILNQLRDLNQKTTEGVDWKDVYESLGEEMLDKLADACDFDRKNQGD